MTTLSDDEFVRAVRDVAGESPDHVYDRVPAEGCMYVNQGVGSCLIGRALIAAGVPLDEVAELDDHGDGEEDSSAQYVLPRFGLSPRAIEWAGLVQNDQDRLIPWGAAVDNADKRIEAKK